MNLLQYFDTIAAEWDNQLEEENLIRLQRIIAELNIKPGAKVLDVGCGTGVLLPFLLKRRSQVVALDFSWEMLKRAKIKGYSAAYVQGDAHHLPLRDEIFDWVICNGVFPHFIDKSRALAEIRRVLRKGGQLIICHTSSRQAINEFHRSIGGAVANDIIPDAEEVRRLIRGAGLNRTVIREEPDLYLVLSCRGDGS